MNKLTKKILTLSLISFGALAFNISANDEKPLVYVSENIGFNVEGYKYKQAALPCDVDKRLAEMLIKTGNKSGLNMEGVTTAEKIRNGTIPVLLIDIEQLSLKQGETYGKSKNFNIPKIQVTAAVLKGQELETAKHTCAITSADKFTMPSDSIKLNTPGVPSCAAAKKCIKDLSKDVIDWLKPQVQ